MGREVPADNMGLGALFIQATDLSDKVDPYKTHVFPIYVDRERHYVIIFAEREWRPCEEWKREAIPYFKEHSGWKKAKPLDEFMSKPTEEYAVEE